MHINDTHPFQHNKKKEYQMSTNHVKQAAMPFGNGVSQEYEHALDASPSPDSEEEIGAMDATLLKLMRRLGIETPLSYQTRQLPLDRLIVAGERLKVSSAQFQTNIALVGVLHPPLVVLEEGKSVDDPQASFRVIAGRRRVLGACRAGMTMMECRVYDALSPQARALIVLSENMHRSPAWIEELKALVELIDERVGMTDAELAKAIGVPVTRVREQLKLAQLPQSILQQIFAGKVNQTTARQMVRLSRQQQATLAELAALGQEITAELVEQTLRGQINRGLAPLQAVLSQAVEAAGRTPSPVPDGAPAHSPVLAGEREQTSPANTPTDQLQQMHEEGEGEGKGEGLDCSEMLSLLSTLDQQLACCQQAARARFLIKALRQEIEVLQRQQAKATVA